MIVLIEHILLLIDVGSDCQLDFPNQAAIILGVDEDITRTQVKSIFDPHYLEFIIDLFQLFEGFHNPDDFLFIGVALAAQKVEYLERDKVY